MSKEVTLFPEKIVYKDRFREVQIPWDNLEHLYVGVVSQFLDSSYVGTFYKVSLVDRSGNKVSLGSEIERPDELGQRLIDLTFKPMLEKYFELYSQGREVNFGPIQVSRQVGLKIRGWFSNDEIPLNHISEYFIKEGYFYVAKKGRWLPPTASFLGVPIFGVRIATIPNIFVMKSLLDAVFGRQAEKSGASST